MRGNLLARLRVCVLAAVCGAAVFACVDPVQAQSLGSLVDDVLEKHDKVIAAEAEVEKARNEAREALGDWFPVLDTTASHGYEHIKNPHDSNSSLPISEVELSLTQLLWDFGATHGAIEKARLELTEKQIALTKVKEELIFDSVEAYNELVFGRQILPLDREFLQNVRKETGATEVGVGLQDIEAEDVLDAKEKLSGAMERVIDSENTLVEGKNRFISLFDFVPDDTALPPPPFPLGILLETLEEAIELAFADNTDLAEEKIAEAIARQEVRTAYGEEFFPKIEGTVERKWKNNASGTVDLKVETLAKVEMNLPFNLGLTAINTLRAAESEVIAKSRSVAAKRREIEQEVRDAWQALRNGRAKSQLRESDLSLAFARLELAKKNYNIGNSTELGVLEKEQTVIDKQVAKLKADLTTMTAAFTLAQVTGRLRDGIFEKITQSLAAPDASFTPLQPDPDRSSLEEGGPVDPAAKVSSALNPGIFATSATHPSPPTPIANSAPMPESGNDASGASFFPKDRAGKKKSAETGSPPPQARHEIVEPVATEGSDEVGLPRAEEAYKNFSDTIRAVISKRTREQEILRVEGRTKGTARPATRLPGSRRLSE